MLGSRIQNSNLSRSFLASASLVAFLCFFCAISPLEVMGGAVDPDLSEYLDESEVSFDLDGNVNIEIPEAAEGGTNGESDR